MRFSSKKTYFLRRESAISEIGRGDEVSKWIATGKFQAGDEILQLNFRAEIKAENLLTVVPAGKEE